MQEELSFTLIITGVIIIYYAYVMFTSNRKKLPREFLFFLSKYGFKIKVLERDLKELCKNGAIDYGTIIFTGMQEIVMQCEDYRITPYQYAENKIRKIKTNKILDRNQKAIIIYTLVLSMFYLIKDYESIYNKLNGLIHDEETREFTEQSNAFEEQSKEIKRFIKENSL